MEDVKEHINRIHNKIQLLLKQLSALEKEKDQLEKDNIRLRQQKEIYESHVKNLQEQNYLLKAATNNMSDVDKTALEQSITKYVRDLDKCIALLSE